MPTTNGELLATIPKTPRAEVRLYLKTYRGRRTVDLRVWWTPPGQTEFVPCQRGVSFDAGKAAMLIEALEKTR